MITHNHPAHGPVSLDRLRQISEILSKAAAQSDGGNLGYAMADAVKVIDVAIAAFDAEPVLYAAEETLAYARMGELHLKCLSQPMGDAVIPLYTAPPAPVVSGFVPAELTREEYRRRFMMEDNFDDTYRGGWNACRSAMLQAGNSPVAPDCWCRTCRPVTMNDMRFVVCPECGNKRCPRANDHRNACTGSNEPDQEGSAYPTAPQQEVKAALKQGRQPNDRQQTGAA